MSVAQHRSFLAFANMISAFQSMPVPKLYQGQQLWVIGARGESGQALVYVKIEYTIPPICMCLDQIDGCRLRPSDCLVITKVETNGVQLQTRLVDQNRQASTFNIKYAYKRATTI